VLQLAIATPVGAIQKCKVKVDKKTGVIRVDASPTVGTLLWGVEPGAEINPLFNAATCVAAGKAKKCELADPATLASKTPPEACTLYLADDSGIDCSVWIRGCIPGPREVDFGITLADHEVRLQAVELCCSIITTTTTTSTTSTTVTTTTTTMTTTTPLAPPAKLVFVTSTSTDGNIGGLVGADAMCAAAAATGSLPGGFRAWISDSTDSPSTRLTQSSGPYHLVSGGLVANNWADLTDGTLNVPISDDEKGLFVGFVEVWTGTFADGTPSGRNCNDWSTTAAVGEYGTSTVTNSGWSFTGGTNCPDVKHIYCVEQ
jgi:hypothetical protein